MLELADRYDSGSYVGNDVRVQVPYSAEKKALFYSVSFLFYRGIWVEGYRKFRAYLSVLFFLYIYSVIYQMKKEAGAFCTASF